MVPAIIRPGLATRTPTIMPAIAVTQSIAAPSTSAVHMSADLTTIDGWVGGPISGIAAAGIGGAAGTASITTGITARALAGMAATGTVAGVMNTGTMTARITGTRIIPIIRTVGTILTMEIIQTLEIVKILGPIQVMGTIQMIGLDRTTEIIQIRRIIQIEARALRGSCPPRRS